MRLVLLFAACLLASQVAACASGSSTPRAPRYSGAAVHGCQHAPGRTGQDGALVPRTPMSLTICSAATRVPGHARPAYTRDSLASGGFDHLLAVLRAGHLQPPKITTCDGGGEARTYTLVFGYRTGPKVSVDVGPDCHPSISNGSVATDNTHAVMVAIDQMIGVRCSALIC